MATATNDSILNLQIDTSELSPAQVRLIKSLNSLLLGVITTDDEAEFFDDSAEAMRICASLIQQSHFTQQFNADKAIPYADQALEYSIDILQEQVSQSKVMVYDN
jgi:hypothetical protein